MDKSTKLLEIATETIYLAGTAEMLDALLDKYDTTPQVQTHWRPSARCCTKRPTGSGISAMAWTR